MRELIFDGHDLSEHFFVEPIDYSIPSLEVRTTEVSGMDGFIVTGTTTSMEPLTVRLTAKPGARAHLRQLRRTLAAILDVDSPRKLCTIEDDGRWRWAIPSGKVDMDRGTDNFAATVSFEFPDPYLYGRERTIPLTSSTTFEVGGTVPAIPTVAFKATPSGGYIGLRLDDGDFIQLAATSQTAVVADCAERTVTADGAVAMLTLDSDWFSLAPGKHTIAQAWGSFTSDQSENYVTFTERWR